MEGNELAGTAQHEDGGSGLSAQVRSWRPSASLAALRQLMRDAADLTPTLARRAELTTSELAALDLLSAAPHGPVELARALRVTSAASSGIVDRLERRGHVVRRPHPTDRRRTQVEVTASGREGALALLMPMLRALRDLDDEFTPAERDVVTRYLAGAHAAIRAHLDTPAPAGPDRDGQDRSGIPGKATSRPHEA